MSEVGDGTQDENGGNRQPKLAKRLIAGTPRLGLPKPMMGKASPALARLNEMVISALGGVQRDWLRGMHHARPIGDGDRTLADRMAERVDHIQLRRQINLEGILQRALTHLPDAVDEGMPDPDWMARFSDAASDISDPAFARIWSRLLVMEVKRAGAVPPIAVLRLPGLSREGLQLFRRFAAFAINNFVVRLGQDFFDTKDVSADQILLLEEYGLIRTSKDLSRLFQSQITAKFSTNLLYADMALRITHEDPTRSLSLPCYRLTEFGATLSRALFAEGEIRADTDYIVELVRFVQKQGFHTAQAEILERADENVVSKHSSFCDLAVLRR